MRIIAGSLRGRVLKSTQTSMLRPTTDRVRESIFNILGARVEFEGARVLDLFAGTGALGIEALSRGAEYCEFVESDRRAAGIITENLKGLGLVERSKLTVRDVMKHLAGLDSEFDLIFADPPYASPLFEPLVREIFARGFLSDSGLLVLEHSSAMKGIEVDGAEVVVSRVFGETGVTMYRPEEGSRKGAKDAKG